MACDDEEYEDGSLKPSMAFKKVIMDEDDDELNDDNEEDDSYEESSYVRTVELDEDGFAIGSDAIIEE
jgi:hypothetical protein